MPVSKLKSSTINLLPKDPFLQSPVGRFLQWAMTVGRYLIIFTQIMVVLTFASRFALDRRITDLNGLLLQKQVIAQSYGDLEPKFRAVQTKAQQYSQVEQRTNPADIFPALKEILPQDIELQELTIRGDQVEVSGYTRSNQSLSYLVNNLQLTNKFTQISVDKIESERNQDQRFFFQITMKYLTDVLEP